MFVRAQNSAGGGGSKSLKCETGTCYPNDYVKQVGNCVFNVGIGGGNSANTAYLRGFVSEGNITMIHNGAAGAYSVTYSNNTLTVVMTNPSGYYPLPNVEIYYEE